MEAGKDVTLKFLISSGSSSFHQHEQRVLVISLINSKFSRKQQIVFSTIPYILTNMTSKVDRP